MTNWTDSHFGSDVESVHKSLAASIEFGSDFSDTVDFGSQGMESGSSGGYFDSDLSESIAFGSDTQWANSHFGLDDGLQGMLDSDLDVDTFAGEGFGTRVRNWWANRKARKAHAAAPAAKLTPTDATQGNLMANDLPTGAGLVADG